MANFTGPLGDFFEGFKESSIDVSSVAPKAERRDATDAGVVNVGWFVRVYFNRIVASCAPGDGSMLNQK